MDFLNKSSTSELTVTAQVPKQGSVMDILGVKNPSSSPNGMLELHMKVLKYLFFKNLLDCKQLWSIAVAVSNRLCLG